MTTEMTPAWLCLSEGLGPLIDRLEAAGMTDVVDPRCPTMG
jgi:hypothetical protein